jgi:leucyl aminopeptidase (aminopeptidase T)
VPPIGLVKEPVKLQVEEGKIAKIEGGKDAVDYEAWLKSFNDPKMFNMAHVCYGFSPGAKLTGNILEDEWVWGCTEWRVGYVWLNDAQLLDRGKVVHKDLIEMAKKLGKP